jgi:hypothetical protein
MEISYYFQNITSFIKAFFITSAEIIYGATITPINTRKEMGRAVNAQHGIINKYQKIDNVE